MIEFSPYMYSDVIAIVYMKPRFKILRIVRLLALLEVFITFYVATAQNLFISSFAIVHSNALHSRSLLASSIFKPIAESLMVY